jgi:hypothetical protein
LPRAETVPAASDEVAKSKKRPRPAGRPATGALPAAAANAPAAVEPAAGKSVDKKLRKGTRGTEMSEDFE